MIDDADFIFSRNPSGVSSGVPSFNPLLSSVFLDKDDIKRRLALTNGIRSKISYDQGSGSRGAILCSSCEQNWATKLLAYKNMFPSRAFVYDRMEPFRQTWADIKISSIKKHLNSDFCSVLRLSNQSSSSDGN